MSKLKLAAEAARRVAVPYKALIEAADEFDRVGALEEHEEGLRARIQSAEEKLNELTTQQANTSIAIADAGRRAEAVMAAAEREAKLDREKAKEYTKKKLADADAEANRILATAQSLSDAAAKERSGQLSAMSRQISESSKALDIAQARRDELKAESVKLESQIADARATLKQMLGA